MVQGYLKPFQDSFQALKYLVVKENTSPMDLQPHAGETDPPTVSSIPTEGEHHDTERTLTPPHQTSSTDLKEHFTRVGELVQFRELVLNQTDQNSAHLLQQQQMEQMRKEQERYHQLDPSKTITERQRRP